LLLQTRRSYYIVYDAHFFWEKKTQKTTCKQNAVRRTKGMELSVHKEASAHDPSPFPSPYPFPNPSCCPPEGESWPCLPAYVRESGSSSSPGSCSSCASLGRGHDHGHHDHGHDLLGHDLLGHDHHGHDHHGHDPGLGLGPYHRCGRPFLGGGADCVSGRGCGAGGSVGRSAKPRKADSWPTECSGEIPQSICHASHNRLLQRHGCCGIPQMHSYEEVARIC